MIDRVPMSDEGFESPQPPGLGECGVLHSAPSPNNSVRFSSIVILPGKSETTLLSSAPS